MKPLLVLEVNWDALSVTSSSMCAVGWDILNMLQ